MKRKKLVVVSHTEHYQENGEIVGWGATVNELNHLADHWDEVVHVAFLYPDAAPKSAIPYARRNIRFVPLRSTGGRQLRQKLNILTNVWDVLRKVATETKNATEVQFRSPTAMGVYLLPAFSFLFRRRYKLWVKYAGSWNSATAVPSYKFQRFWLRRNLAKCPVTINGNFDEQPAHILSFENPCLTDAQFEAGRESQAAKTFEAPFRFAFVGRLEDAKGVSRIIEAMRETDPEMIAGIDFVGDGSRRSEYEEMAFFLGENARFHGFLPPDKVHEIVAKADFLLLPSDSEGFPKVVAEAACYGCIPIVSDVGSVGHFIRDGENGFLCRAMNDDSFKASLAAAVSTASSKLMNVSIAARSTSEAFTFTNYINKLNRLVFNGGIDG